MMTFLAQRWVELTPPQKATWEALAAAIVIPPYNAFLQANLERWGQFKAPGLIYPIAEDGLFPSATFVNVTPGDGYASLNFEISNDRDVWGLMIFRGQVTPLVTSRENCIVVLMHQIEEPFTYDDQGLSPGTYYWNARFFTIHGKLGPQETQKTAIVT
jgi:hypothetical protein